MAGKSSKNGKGDKPGKTPRAKSDVDKFLKDAAGLDTAREKQIGQHIGYRYDVNLLPDYEPADPVPQGLHGVHGLGRPQLARGRAYGLRGGRSRRSSTATSTAGCGFRKR